MNKLLAPFLLASIAACANAQTQRNNETASERAERTEATRPSASEYYAALVGKTFWYRPGRGYTRHPIYLDAKADRHNVVRYDQEIFPKTLAKFEILDLFVLGKVKTEVMDEYTYRLKLEDGTLAFMPAHALGIFTGVPRRAVSDRTEQVNELKMARQSQDSLSLETHVFTEDPRLIVERDDRLQREQREAEERQRLAAQDKREKEERARVAAAKTQAKKGGVRIGMTQRQVLASSWGKPDDINRTITAAGTTEQWVYGGAYLYFENGILATIQN